MPCTIWARVAPLTARAVRRPPVDADAPRVRVAAHQRHAALARQPLVHGSVRAGEHAHRRHSQHRGFAQHRAAAADDEVRGTDQRGAVDHLVQHLHGRQPARHGVVLAALALGARQDQNAHARLGGEALDQPPLHAVAAVVGVDRVVGDRPEGDQPLLVGDAETLAQVRVR